MIIEFLKKHWWQIWYIGSITFLLFVSLIVTSELPCLGYNGPGCADVYPHRWSIRLLAVIVLTNAILAFRAWKTHAIPRPPQPFTWRSTYALPLSFILFFILAGVFLGEQLPALPTYLGDITHPDNKPSILDVATPGDTGVVFFIYAVFGTILWILFRFLNWRLVWVIGALIGLLAEWFLFTGKSGNLTPSQNPIGSTIFLIIIWSVISVVPYFIFRSIDRRWGSRGRWIAIGVILLLNILFTGFFAYQIYVRHNSHRSYPREQSSQSNQGSNNSNDQRSNSSVMIAEKSLTTPFFKESDIASINEAFSTTNNSGWGFEHGGIDFMTDQDFVPFRAAIDSIVESVHLYQLENTHNWQVGVTLIHGESALIYGFETFSSDKNAGEEQLKNIAVQRGQKLQQGDLMGRLHKAGNGAHVHFGVVPNGRDASGQKCPELYFTDDAREMILRIIHKDHPDWQMCYK